MILDNLRTTCEGRSPVVLARHPEWFVDAVLGPRLSPSEAVLVTGFWRSGTTWLLEVLTRSLEAKAVFEPLDPKIGGYRSISTEYYHGTEKAISGFMPYVVDSLAERSSLRRHIVRSLTGAAPGVFTRSARVSIRANEGRDSSWSLIEAKERLADALRNRVVVKFSRAHLLLPLLHSEFRPTIFHIRRDPRAVIESLIRQDWSEWIHEMSLVEYLLEPGDGRLEEFGKWADDIRWCDQEGGRLAPLAGYWALCEWYVDQYTGKERFDVSFEELCRKGSDHLNASEQDQGFTVSPQVMGGESKTSDREKTVNDRIFGWKKRLESEERHTIESVMYRFGMGHFLRSEEKGS